MIEGRFCGRCGALLRRGDPVLLVKIGKSKITKLRGQCCAGQAPPDLPPFVERITAPVLRPFIRTRSLAGMLPLDWKQRAAGREPGEEG